MDLLLLLKPFYKNNKDQTYYIKNIILSIKKEIQLVPPVELNSDSKRIRNDSIEHEDEEDNVQIQSHKKLAKKDTIGIACMIEQNLSDKLIWKFICTSIDIDKSQCFVDSHFIPTALFLISQNRNNLFEKFLSQYKDECQLDTIYYEQLSLRQTIFNLLLSQNNFEFAMKLIGDVNFYANNKIQLDLFEQLVTLLLSTKKEEVLQGILLKPWVINAIKSKDFAQKHFMDAIKIDNSDEKERIMEFWIDSNLMKVDKL